jgi:predicted flap endonuclease-1-like 5' DNA nuclease
MFEEDRGFGVVLGCWAMAAAAAFLAFVLLIVLGGQGFLASAFLSAVLFVVLGALFQAIFASKLPPPGAPPNGGRWLTTLPPEDKTATSVTLAEARRAAEAQGKTPPETPQEAMSPGHTAATAPRANTAPVGAVKAASVSAPSPLQKAGAAVVAPAKPSEAAPAAKQAMTGGTGGKPATLSAPRGGNPDDLKKISGVGPKLEAALNEMGYYHYDQIAAWTADEVAWVDENLVQFKGRVSRDDWVAQAKALLAG